MHSTSGFDAKCCHWGLARAMWQRRRPPLAASSNTNGRWLAQEAVLPVRYQRSEAVCVDKLVDGGGVADAVCGGNVHGCCGARSALNSRSSVSMRQDPGIRNTSRRSALLPG